MATRHPSRRKTPSEHSRTAARGKRRHLRPLKLRALQIAQSPGRTLYTFAVDGKLVHHFATISRVSRSADGLLHGYQRPEVLSHIEEIRDYLESSSPMLPNAIVLAFDSRVRFEPTSGAAHSGCSRPGFLIIPMKDEPDEHKPGFIVDGQQRLAAIRDAAIKHFPICITAFITDDRAQQTEQFMLVNSTKPLPKALLYELLPQTNAQLPSALGRRRLPAMLLDRLNRDEGSPLRGLVRTATNPWGRIKDNSLLKMLENSLNDGALYKFRRYGNHGADLESMVALLRNFWTAVARVFKSEWDLPPRKSRLLHGAGIVSMGFLMDTISDRLDGVPIPTAEQYAEDLQPLQSLCHWTHGAWDLGDRRLRKWNEVQNTSKDISLLSDHLIALYRERVWVARKKPGHLAKR
jgi:DGQHR domain-containing protein